MGERFEIIPCESPDAAGLYVIWDKEAQEVIDVLDHTEAAAYFPDDAL